MKKIVISVAMLFVLSSCSGKPPFVASPTPDPCPLEQIKQFLEAAEGLEYSFNLAAQRADNTADEDLEPIIKEMQVLETKVKAIDPPPCALKAKSALAYYMETLIQGYFRLYFQGIGLPSQSDRTADDIFTLATSQLEYYETKKDELKSIVKERIISE